ncbi:MAG: sugar transferase, partial [Bacteroidales bacterium]|nr:sugar transferase [Bacteroidales bacterium]
PRPERKFFIDQIMERNPAFSELLRIKPGITSWGQVKYGYASDVDQMLERLEYDLYYIRNKSLLLDIKILFCTTGTILKGKGL